MALQPALQSGSSLQPLQGVPGRFERPRLSLRRLELSPPAGESLNLPPPDRDKPLLSAPAYHGHTHNSILLGPTRLVKKKVRGLGQRVAWHVAHRLCWLMTIPASSSQGG
jgi:hypothetical protein